MSLYFPVWLENNCAKFDLDRLKGLGVHLLENKIGEKGVFRHPGFTVVYIFRKILESRRKFGPNKGCGNV